MESEFKTVKAWAGVVENKIHAETTEDAYGEGLMVQCFKLRRDASMRFQRVVRVEIRELPKRKAKR